MKLTIPEMSLVVLVGASGSGKSTFCRKHFKATEILSSDFCRGLVSDDENDQAASKDAFEVLHYIAAKRLERGKLTVIDATNVRKEDRQQYLIIARKYHFIPVVIALNLPESVCYERNKQRPDRTFGFQVVKRHVTEVRRSLSHLKKEGFRYVYILNSLEEIEAVNIELQPLWNNRKEEHGPFDIIGDVHGCCDELEALLNQLGYEATPAISGESSFWSGAVYRHPEGRKAVFLGDLVDRGERILDSLKLARNMVVSGTALCVPGNHENKLWRFLKGNKVSINHGLEKTIAEIESISPEVRESSKQEIMEFLDSLVSHYLLDDGRLVVAHGGMKTEFQGRGSKQVRQFALYGESTGEIDEFGLPVRYPWAAEYRGKAMVVYGHTPIPQPEWLNNTIDIDTGCVFGGSLTALRYPEKELVSVAAARVYCESARPFLAPENSTDELTAQQVLDDVLEIEDVTGKRLIETKLQPKIMIREENSIAALEVMSRFAANPKWLIYLPPTMSPTETSQEAGLLEHPKEAFGYYKHQGISQVVCEEKHMGSRAIAVVCRDKATATKRFGVIDEGIGIIYTRTGRHFFTDLGMQQELLGRLQQALTVTDFWQEYETDWVCLDCELMPWSVKAQQLIKEQYATVGTAAKISLNSAIGMLQKAAGRGLKVGDLLNRYQDRSQLAEQYISAYGRYCWEVKDINDIKIAPFHLLATEKQVHTNKSHLWHLEALGKICQGDEQILLATNYQVVDFQDADSEIAAIGWWEKLCNAGGEGMVVKPLDFIPIGDQGILLQPALKCRGREYLRIIYGPEYSLPENLNRLRSRGVGRKRSLALREFALGIEALERFVNYQPLRQVHECVFGVLALESEPVDPRL